jgi:hypothetical protein
VARVLAAWSISTRVAQPACIAAGGMLAAVTSVRTALFVLAGVVLTSAALLPWRVPATEQTPAEGVAWRVPGTEQTPAEGVASAR